MSLLEDWDTTRTGDQVAGEADDQLTALGAGLGHTAAGATGARPIFGVEPVDRQLTRCAAPHSLLSSPLVFNSSQSMACWLAEGEARLRTWPQSGAW